MAEAYKRNKNHTASDCLSNFPFKQVVIKELDGFTKNFWVAEQLMELCEQSDRAQKDIQR